MTEHPPTPAELPDPAPLPNPAQLRRIACEAAAASAEPLRRAFRSAPDVLAVQTKRNAHDLVTLHDGATEDALIRHLSAAVPGSRFLGEEGGTRGPGGAGSTPWHQRPEARPGGRPRDAESAGVEWIIDPIDGTSNFAHGFAMFSISIAAVVAGEVLAGVVLDPVNGLEFSADDAGAYLNGERFGAGASGAAGADVGQDARDHDESGLNVVTSYPSAEALEIDGAAALERFGALVETYATVRRTVSGALECAFTAIGWADVTLGVDTNPWDVAAGQLLVTRAGGAYLPLFYDTDGPERRAAHLAPCYVAVAPGREAPTAVRLLEQTVTARRAAGYRRH